ncbi:MAG: SDR family NAD(P)-dependent oxidoreductase, partial [Nostoc sp.]|uniref:SDR family oxidoreductase n=1 Tax=Nostoc sp. TaxID=1180 RepID=UPI002FF92CAA
SHVALLVLSIIYSQRIPRELFYNLTDFSNTLSDAIDKIRQKFSAPNDFTSVDVANEQLVEKWAQDVLQKYEPPDIVINNAAITNYPAPLWEIPSEEFSDLIDINIKGVANIIRHFVPAMVKKKRGIIVNFSSGWGRSTSPPSCTILRFQVGNRRINLKSQVTSRKSQVSFVTGI